MSARQLVPGRLVAVDVPQLAAIAAGATVTFDYRWPLTGRVVLLRFDVREAAVDPSDVTLAIATDAGEQLFADVYGGRSVSARLTGSSRPARGAAYSSDRRRGGLLMARPVTAGDIWRVTIANTSASPITPFLAFLTVDA